MTDQDNGKDAVEACPSGGDVKGGDMNEPDEGSDAGKTYPSGDCDLQLIVPERTA